MCVVVKNYQVSDIENLARFFERYRGAFPDAKLAPPEFYTYHPTLKGGRNLFCALDHRDGGSRVRPTGSAGGEHRGLPEWGGRLGGCG